ncbi:beta-galactosidase [Sporocytophaga myxococcoides]|uniref:Beta-glucosidase n=1 Tax=Sporocytophaga myxococcoides TaxID=153721 RepID=A0A098LEE1_9BACT|nr:GH1 family beta-glucosidase [Sporocytophaga myxococcoides]GAL84787.1 beta-galactosidase [Sporocytophaga myxococcoides]
MERRDFGEEFCWGVAVSAYQIEGAHDAEGKGHSIWDIFTNKKGNVLNEHTGNTACDFYNRYSEDISLLKLLNIPNFRFSLSWPRILPSGHFYVNRKGIDYYDRLIDCCLSQGIEPWVTLYHWDLPHELELMGGWTNRDILYWFGDYAELCAKHFGDRVKKWMVLNEPMVFTGAGYFLGIHAPGRRGMKNFVPAMHHAVLAMGEGGRRLRELVKDAEIGTTFSCSYIEPVSERDKDVQAAIRVDALLNRLYVEPILGLGYPKELRKPLLNVEKFIKADDENNMPFDFDFIGIQNYTREIVKYSWWTPYLQASIVGAKERKVPYTLMKWEVYPEAIYHMLKKFQAYPNIKRLMVTENGAAFNDVIFDGKVRDSQRLKFIQDNIRQVLRAKKEGVNVEGYFIWTLTDNFEWAEGFHPRFGIVHVDFDTQKRTIKESGLWYRDFLRSCN